MDNKSDKAKLILPAVISVLGWFAVFLQLYLIIENRVASVPETIVRFFSFFTILTNILVAFCFTILWIKPKNKWELFFLSNKTATAVTLYILIVGIVYNLILRFLWAPTGWQKIDDEILHLIIPVLVLIYWFKSVDKKNLEYKNILPWLIYPSLYLVYTLIRGHFFNFYPYPFVDVIQLGYKAVFTNSFFMVLAFLIVGILLIGISKILSKQKL
ncbi:Pr6Pr family membrane protein [Flavobacterium sp.]|uniref:Pr6Pr family membrane protein n=1 Tax=Flavobacterium sp. TaxID=239 RepID=UPI003751CFFD